MIPNLRSSLSVWAANRLSEGRPVFMRDEAIQETGASHGAFLAAAERLQRRHHLVSPRRSFYVVVPPQFLSWGAPPPTWYIDELMRFENCPYYVGLLRAARLYGATHQAVMEFQVVTDKRLPQLHVGRSPIGFYYRKDISRVQEGVDDHKTDTGRMKVSSPELTVLDLLRYPRGAAGIDNTATVLIDMGDRLDADKLAHLSQAFERSVVQRLGYMLDRFGHADKTGSLKETLPWSRFAWAELDPAEVRGPIFTPKPVVYDKTWRVIVRRVPAPDV